MNISKVSSLYRRLVGAVVALSLSVALTTTAVADDSLYQALGERAGIEQIVEDTLFSAMGNDKIAHHFRDADMPRLHRLISDQICDISGGPCQYDGEDMVKSHTGMNISRGEFNALVEDMQQAFDKNQVPVSAQNRLLALLADMHEEIVNL